MTEAEFDADLLDETRAKLPQDPSKRPVTRVMELGDYNHDGRATEFYLQTSAPACGWQQGIVIGTTAVNPKLHAFGTVKDPNTPLVMKAGAWETLLHSNGIAEMQYVTCGDHGLEEENDRTITARAKGISVADRRYECTEDGKKGKFLGEETF